MASRQVGLLHALHELLGLPLHRLEDCDISSVNLACASDLPGSLDLDIDACLRTLANWAGLVARETSRFFQSFRQRPETFGNSEAYFRLIALITVLQRDLGVRYNPRCIGNWD